MKNEFEPCECGSRTCVFCGQHQSTGDVCLGCDAEDRAASGLMTEDRRKEIQDGLNEAEAATSGCPDCEGGRICSPVCDECQVSEMQDRIRHERSHGAGR